MFKANVPVLMYRLYLVHKIQRNKEDITGHKNLCLVSRLHNYTWVASMLISIEGTSKYQLTFSGL